MLAIILKLWKVWLPLLVLSMAIGWLFKWRADYTEQAITNFKDQLNTKAEIQIAETKQQIMEDFRSGITSIIAGDVIAGMLRAEGIEPTESIGGSGNGLLSTKRDTFHANKLSRGSPKMGSQGGFSTEQIEFLKGNPTLFE